VEVKFSQELRDCGDLPEPPTRVNNARDPQEVGIFIGELAGFALSCREKLRTIVKIVDGHNKNIPKKD
jgi:hypothetical protein